MAISLDGLILPDLIWENEFDWSKVAASVELTLGGRPVVWEGSISKGRMIDLVATEDEGWGPTATCTGGLSRSLVKSLKEKADTVGWTGVLNYEGTSLKVRFRHENYPSVDVRPLIPRPNHEDMDYYMGRIKLMEIN